MAQKPGGFGAGRAADAETQALCDQVKDAALAKAHASGWNGVFSEFKAIEFTTQVVNGTNYLVKVQVSSAPSYAHVKIHKPLPHANAPPSVMEVTVGKARDDPL